MITAVKYDKFRRSTKVTKAEWIFVGPRLWFIQIYLICSDQNNEQLCSAGSVFAYLTQGGSRVQVNIQVNYLHGMLGNEKMSHSMLFKKMIIWFVSLPLRKWTAPNDTSWTIWLQLSFNTQQSPFPPGVLLTLKDSRKVTISPLINDHPSGPTHHRSSRCFTKTSISAGQ